MPINLSKEKTPISMQNPNERVKNFDEVSFGYTSEEAALEANRCLNCKKPLCMQGCPANINIPLFIENIRKKDLKEAYNVIKLSSNLSSICSRVCNQDAQCEGHCIRGKTGEPVAIGRLERYVNDNVDFFKISAELNYLRQKSHKKVAIIGAGPAGLSCADSLSDLGYDVTIFEKNDKAGGILLYGIPYFRLPETLIEDIYKRLKNKNVHFEFNTTFGTHFSLNTLKDEGFAAIFFATGADKGKTMGLENEQLAGIYTSDVFLAKAKFNKQELGNLGDVVVVGGGNSAMDAARTAIRLNHKSVTIVYRRSLEEIPARKDEIKDTLDEGIKINILTNPIKIIGIEHIKEIECVKMKLGEPDSTNRRKPIEIKDSNFNMKCDTLIYAIGSSVPQEIVDNVDQKIVSKYGYFVVDENNLETEINGIFAGGDAVSGPKTVVEAMKMGKDAATHIDEYLKNS